MTGELVQGGYRPVLPQATKYYSEAEQANFRRTIQRALDTKLGRNEAAVFGGIPMSVLKGSNAAFSVPTGSTYTKLLSAGAAAVRSTDGINVVDVTNATITPSLTSDWEVFVKLKYVSGGSGSLAKFNVALFSGGVIYDSCRIPVQLDAAQNIEARFTVLGAPLSNVYDIRVFHSEAGSVVFDLTGSLWGVRRLSSMVGLQT